MLYRLKDFFKDKLNKTSAIHSVRACKNFNKTQKKCMSSCKRQRIQKYQACPFEIESKDGNNLQTKCACYR